MNMNELFLEKRKKWDVLLNMRKSSGKQMIECPSCQEQIESMKLKEEMWICPKCHFYLPMPPKDRLSLFCDEESFRELYTGIHSENPLNFPGYEKKLEKNRKKTGQEEAFVCGTCKIEGRKAAVGVLDGRFLMGSMGTAVGEKIARLAEYAGKRKIPLIIFSASGGARMQEGLFSLMQMAKTAAAIERFKSSGGLFLSCLTNPTTGGVSASYASLGDLIIAEPDALICFAGPRVIKQTIGQTLPDGFQHAEFVLEHGMIDLIVERKELRKIICSILRMHE